MFDIGAGELLVIGIVALVVIGPKELPGVLRQVGKATGKMRQMAGEFRAQFDEAMREAELEEAKKQLASIKDTVVGLDPLAEVTNEIHSSAALLNAPIIPLDAQSPLAPLDVKALPAVPANDSGPKKPEPEAKKPPSRKTAAKKTQDREGEAGTVEKIASMSDRVATKKTASTKAVALAKKPIKSAALKTGSGKS